MRPEAPIADLVGRASQSRAQVRRAIEALVGSNRDARELMLDDKGALKPAAARLLARMAKEARLDRLGFEPDARLQDHLLGRQHIVRYLAAMLDLDVTRLQSLQRKLGDDR
jgi:hypothetical protein